MTDPTKPLKLAQPAPATQREDDDDPSAGLTDAERRLDARRDELFQAYASWCRTRGFYGPPPVNGSVLGKLTKKGSGRASKGGPDAPCSAELAALHLAVVAQPRDALDVRVFRLHYLYNVRNVKEAASEIGVSRSHWYRLLRSVCERIEASKESILEGNLAEAESLPSRGGAPRIPDNED